PETVTTIKNGAFRDMTSLTKVTVEGNVNFENYAFRSVPNLTSIYLLGDDVTFNGSQFATHFDNGDATGITIYVKNATVAARVYAAQSSAYGYEVKILGDETDGSDASEVTLAKDSTQLKDAIEDGKTTIALTAGEDTVKTQQEATDKEEIEETGDPANEQEAEDDEEIVDEQVDTEEDIDNGLEGEVEAVDEEDAA
ncbi:MAG: hypothetical protein GX783_00220, partial [Clostridiales bacterium]|nr:hypothetical protein [Clostridiales bacterium]